MEKMGWEKGRTGLGANQDKMVDHITLKHKKNTRVLASFKGHDDTWLANQNDFQVLSVFVNLNKSFNLSFSDCVGIEKLSRICTRMRRKQFSHEISKKSKRRVHYQKFVKGKDSINYSADDLACNLGTMSDKFKNKSEPSSAQVEPKEDDVKDSNKNSVQS